MSKELINPRVGDGVRADGWPLFECSPLKKDDGFKDSSFPGCMFRIDLDNVHQKSLAVNVTTTGEIKWYQGGYRSRCKIEFVGDGEPSTFSGGYLYHHVSY